jgi:hypothetical protein
MHFVSFLKEKRSLYRMDKGSAMVKKCCADSGHTKLGEPRLDDLRLVMGGGCNAQIAACVKD